MTSSKTFRKLLAVGAAILLSLAGNAVPAQASVFTITYYNGLASTGTLPAAEPTDSNGDLTVNDGSGLHSNVFTFLGWGSYDFNGYPTGSSPTIYGTSSVADSPVIHATANTTLKAVWSQAITSLQMFNTTEIPIWYSPVSNLDSAAPLASDFTVKVNGTPVQVASFTNGKIVLANPLTSSQQVVTASWTPAVGRRLVSDNSYGYVIPGFSNIGVVTNQIQFPINVSSPTSSNITHEGAQFGFTSNFSGSVRYVVKLANGAAPASAQDLATGTYGSGVVTSSTSGTFIGTGSQTLYISGLSASTNYKIWIAGTSSGQTTQYTDMISLAFSTIAAPSAPTFSGTPNVGSTLTASASGFWMYCNSSHAAGAADYTDCSPISGQMGMLNGITAVIPATSMSMQVVNLAGKYITVRVGSLMAATQLIGAGSSNNNNNQGPSNGGTVTANPATPTYSNGTFHSTPATWSGASSNKRGYWYICTSAQSAVRGTISNPKPSGCAPFSVTALNAQTPTWVSANPLTLGSSVEKLVTCVVSACTTATTQTAGSFLAWYEVDNGTWTMSATISYDDATSNVVTPPPSTPSTPSTPSVTLTPGQARMALKPLPANVLPLVAALPQLNKPMVDLGGKLTLTAGNFSGLVSASISGKPLDIAVGSTGGLTLTVPNGKAGTTADLLLNFTSGTVLLQDAIKYVAPLVIANVPERPVSISAGAKKLSQATLDQVIQAAFANPKNNSVSCIAYAVNKSAAAKAAALATAQKVCALATKSNPGLVAAPVTVVVNRAKARTSAVGIKVYQK